MDKALEIKENERFLWVLVHVRRKKLRGKTMISPNIGRTEGHRWKNIMDEKSLSLTQRTCSYRQMIWTEFIRKEPIHIFEKIELRMFWSSTNRIFSSSRKIKINLWKEGSKFTFYMEYHGRIKLQASISKFQLNVVWLLSDKRNPFNPETPFIFSLDVSYDS